MLYIRRLGTHYLSILLLYFKHVSTSTSLRYLSKDDNEILIINNNNNNKRRILTRYCRVFHLFAGTTTLGFSDGVITVCRTFVV